MKRISDALWIAAGAAILVAAAIGAFQYLTEYVGSGRAWADFKLLAAILLIAYGILWALMRWKK